MNNEISTQKTLSGFRYTNIRVDALTSSEYTIAIVVTDLTGSVSSFKADLVEINKTVQGACLKHPKSENLLLRSTVFNSILNVKEMHGFMPVSIIDPTIYDTFPSPDGCTPLMDALLEACESLLQYAQDLASNQFTVNAVLFLITDGGENSSINRDMNKIKKTMASLRNGDPLESFTSILIGVDDASSMQTLKQFQVDTTMDEYKSIGDATPANLAKVAQFISRSISTASVACGSGSANVASSITSLTI